MQVLGDWLGHSIIQLYLLTEPLNSGRRESKIKLRTSRFFFYSQRRKRAGSLPVLLHISYI